MSPDTRPHICIDATCIVLGGKGATVYAISLLKALQRLSPPARFTVLIRQEAVSLLEISSPYWSIQAVNVKSSHLWHLLALPGLLAKLKPDLLHILGEVVLPWLPIPYLLTVHELPHLYRQKVRNRNGWGRGARGKEKSSLFPNSCKKFNQSLYHSLSQYFTEIFLPATCRRAASLLAVSQSTAIDLVQEFQVSPQQISITYEAADIRFFQVNLQPISDWCKSIPRPYLLTFATGDHREVPQQAVQAFGEIASQTPHYLVIAGRCPDWQKSTLVKTATKLGCLERLYFTGHVPDDDLPFLYCDADIYIEMSCYEGFGLQVCEAMATGTVTVASDVAALPEIIGQGGYLVTLGDSTMLADKLITLLTDSSQIQRLSKLAEQQAALFSWDKCARESWAAIEQILTNICSHCGGHEIENATNKPS